MSQYVPAAPGVEQRDTIMIRAFGSIQRSILHKVNAPPLRLSKHRVTTNPV